MLYRAYPPAPQGAVPRTHQAHQDQLGIALAEPALEAVHWNPRPTESGSLGLVFLLLSLRSTRAIGIIYRPNPTAAARRTRTAAPVGTAQPPMEQAHLDIIKAEVKAVGHQSGRNSSKAGSSSGIGHGVH